jgi:hypothetical protein
VSQLLLGLAVSLCVSRDACDPCFHFHVRHQRSHSPAMPRHFGFITENAAVSIIALTESADAVAHSCCAVAEMPLASTHQSWLKSGSKDLLDGASSTHRLQDDC